MKPAARKQAAKYMIENSSLSQRTACRLAGISRSAYAYRACPPNDAKLRNLKPVFFGHYWYQSVIPKKLSDYAACLDYSVANKDINMGKLAAYRMNGESRLQNDHFAYVESIYASAD